MEVFEYFSGEYIFISEAGSNEYAAIDGFLVDVEESEERKYPEPLKAVFMHETKSEMYLIFDCLNHNLEAIKNVCKEWEREILCFVNFGKEYRGNIQNLKYNISLIILYKDEDGVIDDNFRYETEKSLKICRKIFLSCNDERKINEDDRTMIPFYFSPIEKIESNETEALERELGNLLPKDGSEMLSICKKEELVPEDINIMCGWLVENDNN